MKYDVILRWEFKGLANNVPKSTILLQLFVVVVTVVERF